MMPTPISPLSKAQIMEGFKRGKAIATPESGISMGEGTADSSLSTTPRKDNTPITTPNTSFDEEQTPVAEMPINPLCSQLQNVQLQDTPIYEPMSYYPDAYHPDPMSQQPMMMAPVMQPVPMVQMIPVMPYPPPQPMYHQYQQQPPQEPMQPLYIQVPQPQDTPCWTPESSQSYTPVTMPPMGVPPTPDPVEQKIRNAASKQMLTSYQSMKMETVWHGRFNELVSTFPHRWELNAADLIQGFEPDEPNWVPFKDGAKVRFLCPKCSHGWTSMKGRVYYWLRFNQELREGEVVFKLFGQQCQKCKDGTFCHSMWYPDEVKKVVCNLYYFIGQNYYNFPKSYGNGNNIPSLNMGRREGKPRQQHDATLCEACTLGLCREERK